MLVASQRGDVAALERQKGEKLNQEDRACTFFTCFCEFNYIVLEHMLHVCALTRILMSAATVFTDCFLSSPKIDPWVLCLNTNSENRPF